MRNFYDFLFGLGPIFHPAESFNFCILQGSNLGLNPLKTGFFTIAVSKMVSKWSHVYNNHSVL